MPKLIEQSSGRVLLANLEMADTFWARLKGLQFRRELPPDTGLWLAPCSSLHTCFMRFAIDVIMLDRDGEVLGIRRNVRPWRILIAKRGTQAVVETAHQAIEVDRGSRLVVGDSLDHSVSANKRPSAFRRDLA